MAMNLVSFNAKYLPVPISNCIMFTGADGDGIMSFTDAEKNEIQSIRNSPHLYTKMARCIAPSVYGHDEVIIYLLQCKLKSVLHRLREEFY